MKSLDHLKKSKEKAEVNYTDIVNCLNTYEERSPTKNHGIEKLMSKVKDSATTLKTLDGRYIDSKYSFEQKLKQLYKNIEKAEEEHLDKMNNSFVDYLKVWRRYSVNFDKVVFQSFSFPSTLSGFFSCFFFLFFLSNLI